VGVDRIVSADTFFIKKTASAATSTSVMIKANQTVSTVPIRARLMALTSIKIGDQRFFAVSQRLKKCTENQRQSREREYKGFSEL